MPWCTLGSPAASCGGRAAREPGARRCTFPCERSCRCQEHPEQVPKPHNGSIGSFTSVLRSGGDARSGGLCLNSSQPRAGGSRRCTSAALILQAFAVPTQCVGFAQLLTRCSRRTCELRCSHHTRTH